MTVFVLLGSTYTYDLTPASATVTARSHMKVPPWSSVTVGDLLTVSFCEILPRPSGKALDHCTLTIVPPRHTLSTLIPARRTPYMSDS
jgi:hypothetical protein